MTRELLSFGTVVYLCSNLIYFLILLIIIETATAKEYATACNYLLKYKSETVSYCEPLGFRNASGTEMFL